MNILLGLTGSVAAIKFHKLYEELSLVGEVKMVATKSAAKIIQSSLEDAKLGDVRLSLASKIITDEDEWQWKKVGDPVLHVGLANWADVLVLAPLSANTLAKISNGLCDNLLTCIYICYNVEKPFIIAPAMNTNMWNHPLTGKHIAEIKLRNLNRKGIIVDPIEKKLACGDVGIGAMAEAKDIAAAVRKLI